MAIYDHIGTGYDVTRRADPYITRRLAVHLDVQRAARYLDLACGTGNYTIALRTYGGVWHGVDHAAQMLAVAHAKSAAIRWHTADAAALPYADAVFAGVVCTLSIHHFPALVPAFREVRRVLTTGQFVLFTATPQQIQRYWLADYFPRAIAAAAQQMPSLEVIADALKTAGFDSIQTEPYHIRPDLQDWFLYSGKHHPEMYLDAQVRANISTFALLAPDAEVADGCQRLAADLAAGRAPHRTPHEHHDGDYVFVIADAGAS